MLRPVIAEALQTRVGGGYGFDVGAVTIENTSRGPALTLGGLTVRAPSGQRVVSAPRARISVDPLALAFASIRPTSLEVYGIDVRLAVLGSGAIAVSAGDGTMVVDPPPRPEPLGAAPAPANAGSDGAPVSAADKPDQLSTTAAAGRALRALLDLVTGPRSPIAALQRVGVARGRLMFEDQRTGQSTTFDGLSLVFDKASGASRLAVSAKGPNGRWTIDATARGRPGVARSLDVEVKDLSIDEVALATQSRNLPFDFDMPISARMSVDLDAVGRVTGAKGDFHLGSGYLTTSDPDFEPLRFDQAGGAATYDARKRQIALSGLHFVSGETHFTGQGLLSLPQKVGAPWHFDLQTGPGAVIGRETRTDVPVPIQEASLSGRIDRSAQTLFVDRFKVSGPDLHVAGSGEFGWGSANHVAVRVDAGRMTGRTLLRVWPSFIGAPVRAYLRQHLKGGVLEHGTIVSNLDASDLARMKLHLGPVDSHSRIDFTVSNASLDFLPGVPPATGLDVTGRITGRTVLATATRGLIDAGNGRRINLAGGTLRVPDTDPKPTPAVIDLHLTGTMDSLADILSRDGLKAYANLPIDAASVHGQTDGHLQVKMQMSDHMTPADTEIRADATVADFAVDHMIGKERFDHAKLTVSYDAGALQAQGQGRLFGAPATIELDRAAGGVTYATVGMSLDDAARAKQGFSFGPSLTGPVGARMRTALGQSGTMQADVELDFTRAKIDGLFPGVLKPAGRPGKAIFHLVSGSDGARLENLDFEAGSTSARGSLVLDSNASLVQARLAPVRLSPGDDMHIDVDRKGDGMKIVLRGASIDARPFLRGLFSGQGVGKDATGNRDIDLEVRAPIVTGNNHEVITGLDMRLVRRGGFVREFHFGGKIAGHPVTGVMSRAREGQQPTLSVSGTDAGDLLSFLDLYKRMEGGQVQLSMLLGENGLAGQLFIHNFILRDEPALRRLVTESVQKQTAGQNRIDTSIARFSKLQANFQRVDGRIDVRDAAMFGQQIGLTLDGTVDYPRNRVNLSGTFVPAFGVNNLFSRIPLFGMLLGGGQHEGLFGVNFRITGPATGPLLSINPLSAIAPGFLRKIFGVVETGGSTTAPPPLLTMPQEQNAPMTIGPR